MQESRPDPRFRAASLPWGVALAVVLLAWPLGRALLRRRAVRRGGPDRRLRTSLALLFAELKDYGVDLPRSQTLEETSRFLKERVGLDAAAVIDRVQAVLFGGRRATGEDLADVAAATPRAQAQAAGARGPSAGAARPLRPTGDGSGGAERAPDPVGSG